jgi:dCTP deaminase
MAVLSEGEIKKRLKLKPWDPRGLVVTPQFANARNFDADSLDLRLGTDFLLPRIAHQPYYAPDQRSRAVSHTRVHVPLGQYLIVPAHQTVLGATLEFIKLPYDISGEILTKSSVARMFIVIETAPWIHPEYRGCLTLEIANVSNTPTLIYPGRAIGQLILMQVKNARLPRRGRKLDDMYFGPVQPESPSFRNPQDDLKSIGVSKTWIIGRPRRVPGRIT